MAEGSTSDDIVASLRTLLASSKYSDLVIKCRNQTFNVHRNIVCTRSPYFAAACDDIVTFDGEGPEALVLNEHEPDVVTALIEYLYTDNYKVPTKSHLSGKATHALLHIAAYNYDIVPLKNLARSRYEAVQESPWFLADIPSTVRAVYAAKFPRNHALRDSILKMVYANFEFVMAEEQYSSLLNEVPGFAADLLRMVAQTARDSGNHIQRSTRWQCTLCKESFSFLVGVPWFCALCGNPKPKNVS